MWLRIRSCTARLEEDWKPLHRDGHRVHWYEFVGIVEGPRETRDQAMKDRKNLHACELVARTHPRAPAERDECERSRARSFEARWIKLVGIGEILGVSMSRVGRPHYLCGREMHGSNVFCAVFCGSQRNKSSNNWGFWGHYIFNESFVHRSMILCDLFGIWFVDSGETYLPRFRDPKPIEAHLTSCDSEWCRRWWC